MKKILAIGVAALALSACSPPAPNPADQYTGLAEIRQLDRRAKSACIATVRLVGNGKIGTVWVGRGNDCLNGRFHTKQVISLIDGRYV